MFVSGDNLTYNEFFEDLTGRKPFPYQSRIGTEPWPQLLDIPTGLGKTAAVTVAWLYKRLNNDPETGARLIYCLPMRTLVEQTEASARHWCSRAARHFAASGISTPTVHLLMGGDVDDEWVNHPEQNAILVGTQDMLLSRALNRGYALSRYKWPVHFALLNNDCFWVFDETQLIGVGIETSAQLQGFRAKLGAHGSSKTLWMSATLCERQLDTVDHRRSMDDWKRQTLGEDDLREKMVLDRLGASKPIRELKEARLSKESEKQGHVEALVMKVLEEHAERGALTLVIVNRVSRAQTIYQALRRAPGCTDRNVALIHSRFRPADRGLEEAILQDSGANRIVVATQALEAGVDVSARTMFTELAPWPSLVQRWGRCNRYGDEVASVHWVDIDTSDPKSELLLPYQAGELDLARDLLACLESGDGDAGPLRLREVEYEAPAVVRPVIRRRDLLDLFDTSADLSGYDIDISRYVRDGEDTDIQVYWRMFDEQPPGETLLQPSRDELCRVSLSAARDFVGRLDKLRRKLASGGEKEKRRSWFLRAWRWDPLERQWEVTTRLYPGQVLLLHSTAGGYDPRLGWTGEVGPKTLVPSTPSAGGQPAGSDAYGSDWACEGGRWVLLADHLGHVREEVARLSSAVGLDGFRQTLETAALWHDTGKAHEVFQRKLLAPLDTRPDLSPRGEGPWAKSNHHLRSVDERKHFRHELASALAWLSAGDLRERPRWRGLVAYLVAAHHGKVRMSLRSLPGETAPEGVGRLFARGVWDGDVLSPFQLPDGRRFDSVELDLSVMLLGEGSWLERALNLRNAEDLGPFRLALLETVLRVADWRASRKEQEGVHDA